MKNNNIICASYGYGALKFGADKGAVIMHKNLKEKGIESLLIEPDWHLKSEGISEKINCAYDFSKKLSQAVEKIDRPIVIGGDHSIALGTWSGIFKKLIERKSDYKMGLIWIDAHMDSHTPWTSTSKNPHGMSLASLLGYGDKNMCDLGVAQSKVQPENVVIIGTRSYEEEEEKLLKKLGVTILYMEDVKNNLNESINKAVEVLTTNTDGFGVSFDLDAIDPQFMPGTGFREKDGFSPDETFKILEAFKPYKTKIIGLEMVEYFPEYDINDMSLKIYENIFEIYQDLLK